MKHEVRQSMKPLSLIVGFLCSGILCGCSTAPKEEVVTLSPFKDTFDWRPYRLSKATPQSADGLFRFVGVSKTGEVTLIDLSSGQPIALKHVQTVGDSGVSKMPMRVTRFDFEGQTAEFECLTTK